MTEPSQTPRPADLHPIEASEIQARRERVFLVLAGLFLGSMTMLNILGTSRFITLFSIDYTLTSGDIWPIGFAVAVGVLPYPITFLCTDFISEFYGRKRASWLVWVGFFLNVWLALILWLAGALPGTESPEFFHIQRLAFGAIWASMFAYMAAQLCDVYLFHFWKNLTRGKWLWLRNNGSTMISQLVDSTAVILITYWVGGLDGFLRNDVDVWLQLAVLIGTSYFFKVIVAALDTLPFYLGVAWLKNYLQFDPNEEFAGDEEL
ncbi:MAG: queuosine precursor transporter [Planctomycetota bacterium]